MRLINDDCLNILPYLEKETIDLIVTSPPYYNVKKYSQFKDYNTYLEWIKKVFIETYKVLKGGRMCIVNLSCIIMPRKNRQSESKRIPLPFHFVNIMESIGFKFLEDIIWVKPNPSVPNRNGGFYRHRKPIAYKPNCVNEYVFVFQKPNGKLIDHTLKEYDESIIKDSLVRDNYERTNVWSINPSTDKSHPAPYPLELPYKLIEYYSMKGDTVLDMFMGTGTTGMASQKLDRDFIGIEIHNEYYNLAKHNLGVE